MRLPRVVIVGRPNVGKSSLLNMLTRTRVSIVDPRAGITRDRVAVILEHDEHYLELIDTGGIGIVDDDQLEDHVEEQIQFALREADAIIFVTDVRDGVTPMDVEIAQRLRKLDRPVIAAVNKVDEPKLEPAAAEFVTLGFGAPVSLSAHHALGRTPLLERIRALLGDDIGREPPAKPVMKLAIIGKRNAGKSTLVNALAGQERVIVSETPGTTRDAVDVIFERDGRTFVAIDTAGVRKKRSMNDIDFYSYTRALASVRRCDVVMYLIDATVPISEVDMKLIAAVLDEYKPMLLAINKWDLVKGRAGAEDYADYLAKVLPHAPYAPISFMTAQDGRNIGAAVEAAQTLHNQALQRMSTARLNEALQLILSVRGPSAKRGTKQVKIYYATQISTTPPTIVFFCNDPNAVTENYRRFMENRLRELTPFKEVPLRLLFRPRSGRDS